MLYNVQIYKFGIEFLIPQKALSYDNIFFFDVMVFIFVYFPTFRNLVFYFDSVKICDI